MIKDKIAIEGKLAIMKRLKHFASDPLKRKAAEAARKAHKTKLKSFQMDYTARVKAAKKLKSQKARKAALTKVKGSKAQQKKRAAQIADLKKAEVEAASTAKSLKKRKRIRTALALSGVGAGGFYGAKRADVKGKTL